MNSAATPEIDRDYLIGDYCRVIQKADAKDVLLCFSAVGVPLGKFNGTRALSSAPFNIIYLNCPKTWYLNGIPGLGETIEETAQRLKEIIHELPLDHSQSRLFSYGGSMGGYGAVMYGCLLNAEKAIATGAEFRLMISGGATIKALRNRISPKLIQDTDLAGVVKQAETQLYLYYGENNYSDLICGLEVADSQNVSLTTLRNFNHSLPPYISRIYGLEAFLAHHVNNRTPFPFQPEASGDLFACPALIKALHSVVQQNEQVIAQQSNRALIKTLEAAFENQQLSVNIRSHAAFGISVYQKKRSRPKAAILFCQAAVALNSDNLRFQMRLSKLLLEDKRYDEAIAAASNAIALDNLNFNLDGFDAYSVKIKALLSLGHRSLALRTLVAFKSQHCGDNKSDIRRRNRISILEEALNLYALELFDWSSIATTFVPRGKPVRGHFTAHKFDCIAVEPSEANQVSVNFGGVLLGWKPAHTVTQVTAQQQGRINPSVAQTGLTSPVLGKRYPDLRDSNACRFSIKIEAVCKGPPVKIKVTLRNGKTFEIGKLVFALKESDGWLLAQQKFLEQSVVEQMSA